MKHVADCDIFVATAAVCDYRPKEMLDQKMKKSEKNQLTVFTKKGGVYHLPLKDKKLLAMDLMQLVMDYQNYQASN